MVVMVLVVMIMVVSMIIVRKYCFKAFLEVLNAVAEDFGEGNEDHYSGVGRDGN